MTSKIDTTLPSRVSMNVTVGKQTQGTSFGEKLSYGLQQTGNVVAQAAQLVGGAIPGAGIISAAVTSVGKFTPGLSGSSAVAAGYAASGVLPVGGGVTTTAGGVSANNPTVTSAATGGQVGMMNNELATMADQNAQLLQVQIAMQHENQVFTSVSNCLKARHDTQKNSIGNMH